MIMNTYFLTFKNLVIKINMFKVMCDMFGEFIFKQLSNPFKRND